MANTERHLDVSKGHSQRAADKTDELKQLNRSIFRPVITFNKDAKRAAKEAEVQRRYDEDRDERERTMVDIRESQNRIGRAGTYGQDDDEGIGRRGLNASQQALRKEQRKRYQFEATASDDELEDELDDNLNEISDVAKRLKMLGSAMGQELDKQNERIDRLGDKASRLDQHVFTNTERVRLSSVFFVDASLTWHRLAQAYQVSYRYGGTSVFKRWDSYDWFIGYCILREWFRFSLFRCVARV